MRKPLPFKLDHKIDESIRELKDELVKKGEPATLESVMLDCADYCGVARETVRGIRRKLINPSAPLALKLAEYFGKPVEELFWLVEEEEDE